MQEESRTKTSFTKAWKVVVATFTIILGAILSVYLAFWLTEPGRLSQLLRVVNDRLLFSGSAVAVALVLTFFLYKKFVRSAVLWIAGFLPVFLFAVLLSVAREPHGGIYLQSRQCHNVESIIEHIEVYRNQTENYPDSLDELSIYDFGMDVLPLRLYEFQPVVAYLGEYKYRRMADGYELEFVGPNKKVYKIRSENELELICAIENRERL